jgi:hypothetical protein
VVVIGAAKTFRDTVMIYFLPLCTFIYLFILGEFKDISSSYYPSWHEIVGMIGNE